VLDRSLSPAAARQRRSRWRRRNGLVPRTIDVDEHALAAALIESGRLTADEALRPSERQRVWQGRHRGRRERLGFRPPTL
jgi:hypothetical protein